MLRVTVELVPFGDEERKKPIAEMVIGNVGKNATTGWGYDYVFATKEPKPVASGIPTETSGMIRNYNRMASVWDIVYAAIDQGFDPQTEYEKTMLKLCKSKLSA